MSNENESYYNADFTGVLVAVDGTRRWFIKGMYGRLDEGPSVEYPDGGYCYYLHPHNAEAWEKLTVSIPHRQNGPAISYPDGTQYFYEFGRLHRNPLQGPAVIHSDGSEEYWFEGRHLAPIEVEEIFNKDEAHQSFLENGDPDYPVSKWKTEVVALATQYGYTEWLERKRAGQDVTDSEDIDSFSESLSLLSLKYGIPTNRVLDQLIINREAEVLASLEDLEKALFKKRKIRSLEKYSPTLNIEKRIKGHSIFKLEHWIRDVTANLTRDDYLDWLEQHFEESDSSFREKTTLSESELRRNSKISWVALQRLASYYDSSEEDVTVDIVLTEYLRTHTG